MKQGKGDKREMKGGEEEGGAREKETRRSKGRDAGQDGGVWLKKTLK